MIISLDSRMGIISRTGSGEWISKLLDAVFEHSKTAIELYDFDGTLIDINPASLAIFGIDGKKEIESFNFFDDPNITELRKKDIFEGKIVKYGTVIDFDAVKKSNLFSTNKSGKVSLSVTIIPILNEENQLFRILFLGEEQLDCLDV